MRISDWSSDVCSSDLLPPVSPRFSVSPAGSALTPCCTGTVIAGNLSPTVSTVISPLVSIDGISFAAAYDGLASSDQINYSVYIDRLRSEEHTSELQSLMRISYAVFCLKKKKTPKHKSKHNTV